VELSRSIDWRPSDLGWRVAWQFIVGSALFALGSFPPYSQNVDPGAVGITFVVGSVFFTWAAFGQLLQSDRAIDHSSPAPPRTGWWPPRATWWAAVIQLVGTVLFNLNTFDAMLDGLTTEQVNRLVWAPDIFGSIAFLVASHLAWLDLGGGHVRRPRGDDPDWWSGLINYIGSVLFMASAIASLTLPTDDQMLNTTLVNSATFGGALCFLVGAYLLLPRTGAARTH
jgi:hypothetical protein